MFRTATVAVVLCLVTLSAGFLVDAKARGMMAHHPWPGSASALGELVIHEYPTVAEASAYERALGHAQDACGDRLEMVAVSVAEVTVNAGGETSTQVEVEYDCVPI